MTPNTASVALHIAFPLNTFFSMTILTETQSITALLSTIVGLAGIFSLFGTLLSVTDVGIAYFCKNRRILVKRKNGGTLSSDDKSIIKVADDGGDDAIISPITNPLAITGTFSTTGVTSTVVEETVWKKVNDNEDEWFVNDKGETAWVLPDGATLI